MNQSDCSTGRYCLFQRLPQIRKAKKNTGKLVKGKTILRFQQYLINI